jgi:YVTN family beta-propeller protein
MINLRNTVFLAALSALVLLGILMSGAGLQAAPTLADAPAVIGTVVLGPGDASLGPEGVAIDPSRNRIFVTNSKNSTVYVISGDTNQVMTITHSALVTPWGAAYNPNNGRVYVASNGRNSVVVINSATLAVEQEIGDSSINMPDQVAVDAIHNLIYVTNSSGGQVTVINGQNNTIAARFSAVFSTPHSIALDPARLRAYVTSLFYNPADGPDFMMVFSTLSFTEIGRRNALAGPNGLAVRSVDGRIYVAQNYSDTTQWRVAVVNASDMSFAVGFPGILVGGSKLMGMTYSAGSDRIYVNGYGSNTVDVIDAANNTLLATLPVGANPASGIAVNPNTGKVYVANRGSGSVTIIQDTPAGPTPTPTMAATPTPTPTPLCFGDGYEVDNTPAQAKMINTAGLAQNHNICPNGDKDWMTFQVAGPVQLTMQTRNLIGGTDTMLSLYSADGETLLAFNDDAGVGAGGPDISVNLDKSGLSNEALASRVVYDFIKPGRYYIMVKDFDPQAFGSTRRYDVLISGGPAYGHSVFLPVIISDF